MRTQPLLPAAAASLGFFAGQAAAGSKLFAGGTIVAFDSGSESIRVVRDGHLLVTDDRIAGIFESAPDNSSLPAHTERIDVTGQILTPGFIDTHRHGWQTAYKTIGSNTTLAEYVGRYGEFASAPHWTAEDVYNSQLAGLYESLNAGVTTSLDHAHHTWSNETAYAGLNASIASGARIVWAYTVHPLETVDFPVAEQLANLREIAQSAALAESSRTELGVAFDFFSGADTKLIEEVVALAKEFNVSAVTTHSVNGPFGFYNVPSAVHQYGLLNTSIPVIFSHASFLAAVDAQLLRQTNQFISITPESEMHYGHTHEESYYINDQAALGVDTHFTFSTDILTQARIWLQSVRYFFFNIVAKQWQEPVTNPMSVDQAFKLATRHGGLALRRPDLGVIEVGAKADLVVWNARESPSLLGWNDPVAAVMLHASVAEILHVTVDGEFVKKDGRLTAENYYTDVRSKFLETASRIQGIWKDLPYPQLSGPNFVGFEQVHTTEVDSQRGNGTGYGETFIE
ncbi:uncharacterized protein B0I36DRAFT_319548 [Microdochium trichocladiopsis]|uniref:Amidohydrolase-related domain-containing protein n=1 Tax=Microdochium trichocladiopsis TaxID=1682393 RepID=A0A9P8YCN0_9PEZI|nr:uncharacterized protein B0I36DRAFT_319548 [Microdochium trichocladiopsis]KAH7036023.1 hypothetical protein B0I36DRAFT_319548 [Microdochium trichocladiopsis]